MIRSTSDPSPARLPGRHPLPRPMPTPLKHRPIFMPPVIRRRRNRSPGIPAPVVPGPTLTAAEYEPGYNILLTFDRAVNIDDIVPARIIVDDAQYEHSRYVGTSASLESGGTVVMVDLVAEGPELPPGDATLTAPNNTGIVAVDTGGEWSGVSALVLPFA